MRMIDAGEVRANLTYEVCIPAVRAAMIALSAGVTRQLLRSIMHFEDGRMFGVMPGAMGDAAAFGAKILSVFPKNFEVGRPSHQGVILLFDPVTHRLLGGGIVGPNAGDLISEVAVAIEMGADATDISLTVHPHPTLSETVAFAAEAVDGTLTDLYIPKKK